MTLEEFRTYGHQLIDRITDYHGGIADRPVMAQVRPGELIASLPEEPPLQGENFAAVLADLDNLILPGLSHWQHPSFFGYFPANSNLASVLGDYLSTGLGVLGLSWQSSPALTELEETSVDWVRQMLGLSANWSGVIQDTASTSTLVALISAREKASDYALVKGGLQAQAQPLIIYTSAHAHSSVDKAALLAGFGKDNIRYIDTDAYYAMRPEALAAAIERDLAEGLVPCAVVATIGTTSTTAVDPLRPIGALTRQHDLWLHVDSAMAGSAMILPECRWMWDGIEQANSIVVNAHKWLGVAFDCSLYFVRDPQHLIRVMSTNPSYLQSGVDSEVKNLRDWGIPLGRRFRALKLWFLLRSEGVEGLQRRLRRDLDNAQWLAAQICASEEWKVLAPVHLQTLCLRHEPAGLEGELLDRHTRGWADALNASGHAYVTPATLDGRWMVRISIGALPTEREHVAALWERLQEIVRC
ncbi:pyridoxal phosphate-dependent decarboxylase family protein [Pseudomonas chlororaphis]|uniref:Aromatic-L-amino-acid decarboxylase n=1 Tax=Pseudomonas chlororaphis TaxID=587753 RepID=A0AAX3FV17_9PSED|nr:pyridoxal-dependent decarboxylase [Pseudomonas chlororaphis]AZC39857.1 Aromatic-L-amino-acid decarboxylase [Pseudomonas chlororaphis subsp. piscium]AZC46414.1 Aromatic-L-amino-acid decarboxylase [Pseudomonas chlororaphis subsp. piscium]AZC59404.1 Aromatic-L-amino-acid decarboxylase [Pseudomonas chlororaphis subsp. piscium]WDG71921.1 pyridoxal-dependent decarboxylase [Pseudomonas chlororaphis]WDH30295.1 pyridoxal-dependent decarboxylase [Pseudomonas chlororaphis]